MKRNIYHVLTITTSFPVNENDFAGIFILRTLNCQSEINHEVIVPYNENTIDQNYLKNIKLHRIKYAPKKFPFLTLSSIKGGIPETIKKYPWAILFYPIMMILFCIKTIQLTQKNTILHVHWLPNGLIGVIVKKLLNKPFIITLHGSDQNLLSIPIIRVICKWILKNADAVTTVSINLKNRLYDLYGIDKKISFIPYGVDLPTIGNRKKTSNFRLLFVGNLTKVKGVDILIKSLSLIKKIEDINLTIIGDGPEFNNLQKLTWKEDLQKFVDFLGVKPPNKIQNDMLKYDCLILPSWSEGTPNVVKEAMACALPIVATNIGGTPELITNNMNGLLFEPGDTKTLAKHIEYLNQNRQDAIEMGLQGRKFIRDQNLTWNYTASKYMELYNSFTCG